MNKETYIIAFLHIAVAFETISLHEQRVPNNTDCKRMVRRIFKQFGIELNLYRNRLFCARMIDTELLINWLDTAEDESKITVQLFYEGIRYGNYELTIYIDGDIYISGGLIGANFLLQGECESKLKLN